MVVVASQGAVEENAQYFLHLLVSLCPQNGESSRKKRESADGQPWINLRSLSGLRLPRTMIMIMPRFSMDRGAHA